MNSKLCHSKRTPQAGKFLRLKSYLGYSYPLCLALLLTACATGSSFTEQLSTTLNNAGTVITETSTSLGLNPNAANWEVTATALPGNRYQLLLKMKRLHNGGDGEAWQIFNQYATQLSQKEDFLSYRTLNYQESINSAVFASQRTAQGIIQLEKP